MHHIGHGLIGTTSIAELLGDAHYLQDRMSDACLILIGAEMLKMITSYTSTRWSTSCCSRSRVR